MNLLRIYFPFTWITKTAPKGVTYKTLFSPRVTTAFLFLAFFSAIVECTSLFSFFPRLLLCRHTAQPTKQLNKTITPTTGTPNKTTFSVQKRFHRVSPGLISREATVKTNQTQYLEG